jgi:hypothetical protein
MYGIRFLSPRVASPRVYYAPEKEGKLWRELVDIQSSVDNDDLIPGQKLRLASLQCLDLVE